MEARMLKTVALIVALLCPCAALAQTRSAPPEPIQVMIIGAPHFDNPGRDLNNSRIDPVTTPDKQAELAAVTTGLARFRPTAIALERVAADPATLRDQNWPAYSADDLLTDADERVQIGYRLAAQAGVDRVYAIDEQSETRDYFPFGPVMAWLEARDRASDFERLNAPIAAESRAMEERQRTESLGSILAYKSSREHPVSGDRSAQFHYGLLGFGDGVEQPGAALNAGWYERNARIFTKLMAVAQPGDRIVVIFGSGHAYWLRHFAENTPGFELVDPASYLFAD
jgi:hypothetical protein